MDFNTNRVNTYITSVILTFMGILTIQLSFMYTFFENSFYASLGMMMYVLFLSLLFCASAVFVKYKWILPVCIIIICGCIVGTNFYEIAGGFGSIFNTVADAVSEYFNAEVLYIFMTSKMIKFGDPKLFSYVAATLLTLVYSYTISTRKAVIIPLLITLASVGMPVFVEVFPSFFSVLLAIVYCIQMIILSASIVNKNYQNIFMTEVIAIIVGVFLMICGGIINVIVPHDDFKQNNFFVEFNDSVQKELDAMREGIAGQFGEMSASSIGAGKLGHVNRLTFSGEEVLTVKLPEKKDTIYLKGYIGQTYDGNRWIEPKADKNKSLFDSMENNGYNQLEMVGAYLNFLYEDDKFNGYMTEMQIKHKNKAILGERYFSPIYPTPYASIYANADGAAGYINDNAKYEYCSMDGWDFLIDTPVLNSIHLVNLEYQYRNYVKDTYLDVNTTIADELKEKWGTYPIETARDRLTLAMDIRDYLDDNCTYTTSPGKLPSNKDFVEHFLNDTNEGYCTYFATAAVMMFRSAGVPARYVEGYCFKVTDDEKNDGLGMIKTGKNSWEQVEFCEVSVKDSNAHAWVEFYVNGIGWIDFEVTPGNNDGMAELPEPETETEEPTTEPDTDETTEEPTTKNSENETTTKDMTETSSEDVSGGSGGGGHRFRLPKIAEKIILIVFVCSLIIIVTVVIIRLNHLKCIKKREAAYNDDLINLTGESVLMNYHRFERLMKYSGFVKQPHMTYMDFAKMVEEQSKTVGKGEACRLVQIYEQIHYSQLKISKEDVEICNSIVADIYDRIYGNIGLLQKFVLLYILNY